MDGLLTAPSTADAEMKVPSVENPELSKVLFFSQPEVSQNTALHAFLTAVLSVFVIIASLIHSALCSPTLCRHLESYVMNQTRDLLTCFSQWYDLCD